MFLTLGFVFAGVQEGVHCFCGNNYGKHGPVQESDCDTTCPGEPSIACGGDMTNSIYTGYKRSVLFFFSVFLFV